MWHPKRDVEALLMRSLAGSGPARVPQAGGVIVSQPVHQHAYESAVAAQESGTLNRYVTGFYRTGRGISSPRIIERLPRGWRPAADRMWQRRWHRSLDPQRVETLPLYHVVSIAYRSIRGIPLLNRWDAEAWAGRQFDSAVSRHLSAWRPTLVHAFEGTALETFRAAGCLGITRLLDVPNALEYATSAIAAEGGRPPTLSAIENVRTERAQADVILAPSAFVVNCLLENGVSKDRIVRLPYGVDVSRFRPSTDRRDARLRVLFVGQVGVRKGVRYLLEAWRRLALPNAELVLIGAADDEGVRLLRGLPPSTRWLGRVHRLDIVDWFLRSDIFVFPSLAEGSALVTYEAMAAGLAVVTTPNAGSIIRDGVDGIIVPPRTVDEIASSILTLALDDTLRRAMGAAARESVVRNYTWKHYRERLSLLYRSLLAGEDHQTAIGLPS